MARSLLDQRLLDMDINPMFFKVARGEPVDLYDMKEMDSALGGTLEKLQIALDQWKAGGRKGPISVDGMPLDDLCLTFTLPGWCPTPHSNLGVSQQPFVQAIVLLRMSE